MELILRHGCPDARDRVLKLITMVHLVYAEIIFKQRKHGLNDQINNLPSISHPLIILARNTSILHSILLSLLFVNGTLVLFSCILRVAPTCDVVYSYILYILFVFCPLFRRLAPITLLINFYRLKHDQGYRKSYNGCQKSRRKYRMGVARILGYLEREGGGGGGGGANCWGCRLSHVTGQTTFCRQNWSYNNWNKQIHVLSVF